MFYLSRLVHNGVTVTLALSAGRGNEAHYDHHPLRRRAYGSLKCLSEEDSFRNGSNA
jgi:hypothetical protein